MGVQETEVLNQIAQQTQSDLIRFFIILAVVLLVIVVPLYGMILKDRKERRENETRREKAEAEAANIRQDKYIEREKQIIQVIMANTEVMAGLKVTLETSGAATNSSLVRIHDRIDEQHKKFMSMTEHVVQMQITLDHCIGNQSAILDGINKTLLIVDSLPHSSNFGKGGIDIGKEE